MPHHDKQHHDHLVDVWAVEGKFSHLIYSPKGEIEGLLIDTDGVPTQFVVDPHDSSTSDQMQLLRSGQRLVVEGIVAEPSHKGEPEHAVYAFERIASINGKEVPQPLSRASAEGKIVRFNYARHGARNGVVLDSGDFIHTKPDGLEMLGLQIGDRVVVEGESRPLATGTGRVFEARLVNGREVRLKH